MNRSFRGNNTTLLSKQIQAAHEDQAGDKIGGMVVRHEGIMQCLDCTLELAENKFLQEGVICKLIMHSE